MNKKYKENNIDNDITSIDCNVLGIFDSLDRISSSLSDSDDIFYINSQINYIKNNLKNIQSNIKKFNNH